MGSKIKAGGLGFPGIELLLKRNGFHWHSKKASQGKRASIEQRLALSNVTVVIGSVPTLRCGAAKNPFPGGGLWRSVAGYGGLAMSSPKGFIVCIACGHWMLFGDLLPMTCVLDCR